MALTTVDAESPEMVNCGVNGLLNKITSENFELISDQIVAWANRSEKENDGHTLVQVITLVFEKATDDATWSEIYAHLCRKMMDNIHPNIQNYEMRNSEGKPITGGQLFRKCLLDRCQEDFERGWVAKDITAAAAAAKAIEDRAVKEASDRAQEDGKGDEEEVIYSDEYYAAQTARRQGLGLIKFIGELFKLQMLTERIMHECVRKLLSNVDNPEEEEIESLCMLLTTVGKILDTPKARAHFDVYFSRMKELTKNPGINSRMQYMLIDLIELRERRWVSSTAVAAPTTIAQIHEAAAKEKIAAEKESYQRLVSMSYGSLRRGGDLGDYPQVGPDGWAVAGGRSGPTRPPKVGDLSNFGKFSKGCAPTTFGPSSVFSNKKGAESKRESIWHTSSSSDMFSMLSSQAAPKAPAEPVQRKRLVLQPRSKLEREAQMPDLVVKKKVAEDTGELFAIRNLGKTYFAALPAQHHRTFIYSLVLKALESKEPEARLVAEFFARSTDKCSAFEFEEGFTNAAKLLEAIISITPNAIQLFVLMLKGAKLDKKACARIAASSSSESDILLALLESPRSTEDGAEVREHLSSSPVTPPVNSAVHNEDSKESDIAAIKYLVRSLVKRLKEDQRLETNSQEPTLNHISFSVTDEEDRNIIAIINLMVSTKEEMN